MQSNYNAQVRSRVTPIRPTRSSAESPRRVRCSVIAIETTKQRALCGLAFKHATPKGRIIDNWTEEDARELQCLINQWDRATGLIGLCNLIDDYPFSDGTHNKVLARSHPRGVDVE
jgi:hypothetical protein